MWGWPCRIWDNTGTKAACRRLTTSVGLSLQCWRAAQAAQMPWLTMVLSAGSFRPMSRSHQAQTVTMGMTSYLCRS